MSVKELDRVRVLERRKSRLLSQKEGADVLGISIRQMRRLEQRFKSGGPCALAHKGRGRKGNRRVRPEALHALNRLFENERMADFGPTLIQEAVAEAGHSLSKETVRRHMIAKGRWQAKRPKQVRVYARRARRSQRGALIQVDGSHHAWFEERGPRCTLLVAIDDATSTIEALRFEPTETAEGYMRLFACLFRREGLPEAIYSDRHSTFKVNHPNALDHETQFRRSMRLLNVDCICAKTPQAKGRVERCNETLQDRLVKRLRMKNVCSIEEASEVLEEYRLEHNQRFAVEAANSKSAYRAVDDWQKIDWAFSARSERIVTKDMTVRFGGAVYQLDEPHKIHRLRGKKVILVHTGNQVTGIEWQDSRLRWRQFNEHSPEAVPIVEAKDLHAMEGARRWAEKKAPPSAIQRARRAAQGC